MSDHKKSSSDESQPQQDLDTTRTAFGTTENKSLATTVEETKDQDTVSVVMVHHGSHDGKDLLPGETYDLPRAVALSLVSARRAKSA